MSARMFRIMSAWSVAGLLWAVPVLAAKIRRSYEEARTDPAEPRHKTWGRLVRQGLDHRAAEMKYVVTGK